MSLAVHRWPAGSRIVARRTGLRRFGVPERGPFDRFHAELANQTAGNDRNAPVLELLLGPAEFEALQPMAIAWAGARGDVRIERAQPSSLPPTRLGAGDRLAIGPLTAGVRLYLAVGGGFAVPESPTGSGATLALGPRPVRPPLDWIPPLATPHRTLACVPGDSIAGFDHRDQAARSLVVGIHSDRRGVRLEGWPARHEIRRRSEPQAFGSIQWTPSGELIVLGPDGPTIGGYPRVGFVAECSLGDVGQLRPGDRVSLEWIGPEEAEFRSRAKWSALERLESLRG